ncbi:unnamed protein product [Rotaria socialis]|uniref:Uncharacterized protein n=1 Tax=Rotaria socialis TaxID=392032 RepID=A0A821AMQ6_9BILA|nr:unnamed protein product [Rotaria socialis]
MNTKFINKLPSKTIINLSSSSVVSTSTPVSNRNTFLYDKSLDDFSSTTLTIIKYMPTPKNESYSSQTSENIFRLANVAPIPFNLSEVFGDFNQPALRRFFDEHKKLGLDISPFIFGFLVHAAVMLDGAELYNPDGTGYFSSMNLFVQLIGEPGTNKSGILRSFSSTMSVLSRVFPQFFSKPVTENVIGKETVDNIDLIVNNDTELSLFQKLSKRENVFIFSDELDVINIRFGVYLGGSMDNDVKTIGSRLLCQGYDVIKDLSRTTGSTSFYIDRGSINIFGASTGNMLSTVYRQYRNSLMSDGTVSRFIYIATSAHKPVDPPGEILSPQPNMVHILIIIRLLGEYKPIFVFGDYEKEPEVPNTVTIPNDIQQLIRDNDNSISPTENIKELKPSVVIPYEESDREIDGSLLSPRIALKRTMDYYHNKSLQTDQQGSSIYTPLQRAFYRKSGIKLARISALCYAISYAIKICYESIHLIRFGDGLFVKDRIDIQQYNRLFLFYDHAKKIIKEKMDQLPSYGSNNRPLIVVNKAAVKAAEVLFEYSSKTIELLFDDSALIKVNNDSSLIKVNNDSSNIANILSTKNPFFEEQTILLTMTSPILSKAWFTNPTTGLPYTGIFKNYAKSKSKMIRLTEAINYLVNTDLVQCGTGNKKHLVGARKETFIKIPPCIIRTDQKRLTALKSININIDQYEHIYMHSPLPTNMELTEETIKLILSNDNYIPIVHLFNDIRIEQEMERRVAAYMVHQEFIQGKNQYHIISSSQQIDHNNIYVQDIFEFDLDSLSNNNNNNSSTSDVPVLPIDSLLPSSSSSPHIEKSLFSSLCTSSLTTRNSTNNALPNQNHQENISFEQELFEIEQDFLKSRCDSSISINTNIINNMSNENILVTQVSDPGVHNALVLTNQLVDLEMNTSSNLRETQTINTLQSFKPTSTLSRNTNFSLKRLLEEENENYRKKQQKHTTDENEVGESTTSPVGYKWSLTQPVLSSPINTNSTITIGSTHIDTNLLQNNSAIFAQPSTVTNINMSCDDVDAASFIVNTLANNVHNPITSSICQTDNIQSDVFHSTSSTLITTAVNMSNSVSMTDYQHHNTNKSLFYRDMSVQADTEPSFDTTISSSNIVVPISPNDNEINMNLDTNKPSIDTEKNDCFSSTKKTDDKILSQIYNKLILSDSIVMSKTDICIRLKHVSTSTRIRDQAINDLVNDKLLVIGDWFSIKNIKGVVNFTGYLKGFPENNVRSQMEFASTLAKYSIDFIEFENSFRKDKVVLPRTLDASDIKQSKWLYSQALMDTVLCNNFLKERVIIDPSAVLHLANIQSKHVKRIRKPRKTFSPSDQN